MPTPALPCPCGLPAAYPDCCGRSWHPTTRPARLDLDPGQRWERLEILATERGGMFETEGSVEFRAHYREGRHTGSLHEHSGFSREGGAWVYVGPLSPVDFD
ncbi:MULTISPECIES: YchJ family protein [unclassified Streptomyces]|uniref:YchJ family protein n=1 Tax=unclassified Streptomyces TaxID=2593676 RepID=UPI001BEC286E|nr:MULTISPECIES: YchJ family metal-binding protein [unclassified Streptomyces]MBT2407818.1 hypothetical protein [Streptomyces sp. ISL-21]MBT2608492.1 hypothetical protein [Streptomyces sp. ISL-87]